MADWADRLPYHQLQGWTSLVQQPPKHPIAKTFKTFVQEGIPYPAEVFLNQIGGLMGSCGDYLMHLDRLPETMDPEKYVNFGPLSPAEMAKLEDEVYIDFRSKNRRFDLAFQEWDQLYIGANHGASRRFALWRRLNRINGRQVQVDANITPYRINLEVLRSLREEYRAVGIKADTKLLHILDDAGDIARDFAYLGADVLKTSTKAILLIPYPHRFQKAHLSLALELHNQVESFTDLGRYVAERMSFVKTSSAAELRLR